MPRQTLDWNRTERDLRAGVYVLVSETGQLWEVGWDRAYLNKDVRDRDELGPEWKVKKMVLAQSRSERQP